MIALEGATSPVPSAAVASEWPTLFETLPGHAKEGDAKEGVFVEAVFAVRDLRELSSAGDLYNEVYSLSKVGQAYQSKEMKTHPLSMGFWEDAKAIADLLAPAGSAVPMFLVAYSGKGDWSWQLMFKVEPGLKDRIGPYNQKYPDKSWRFLSTTGGMEVRVGETHLPATIGEDLWLRAATKRDQIITTTNKSKTLLSETLMKEIADEPVIAFVRRGGLLTSLLDMQFLSSPGDAIFRGIKNLVWTWSFKDRTPRSKLLVDWPHLVEVEPALPRQKAQEGALSLWDEQAVTALGLSVPPALIAAGASFAANSAAGGSPEELDSFLRMLLPGMSGNLSFASFGSPADWAFALSFDDATAAQRVVPELKTYLSEIAKKYKVSSDPLVLMQKSKGQNALHLRPDVLLEGVRVVALGNHLVVVGEKYRFERLAALLSKSKEAPESFLDGPVTKSMRKIFRDPSLIYFYSVLGYNMTSYDWLAWIGTSLGLVAEGFEGSANSEILKEFGAQPALHLALGLYLGMMTYDVAVVGDLHQGILRFEFLSSML